MFMELPPNRWRQIKDFGRDYLPEIIFVGALFAGSLATALVAQSDESRPIPAEACVFSNNYDPAAVHPVPVSGPKQYGEAARQIAHLDLDCLSTAMDVIENLNNPPRTNEGYLLVPTEQLSDSKPQN